MRDRCELSINTIIVLSSDLLKKDRSFTIHQRNIQLLAVELFKVKGNLSSNIITFFKLEKLTTTWGHKPVLLVFV